MLGSCRGGSSREGEILYDSEGASLSRDISRGSIVLFMLCDVRKHGEVTGACRSCSRRPSRSAAVVNDEVKMCLAVWLLEVEMKVKLIGG